MNATVRWIQGLTLVGVSDSNHWIVMDTDADVGGSGGAAKPLELVLIGLGGCTAMDVVSMLKKMHVSLDAFEIRLHADRAEDHPKVFTKIRLEYRLFGKDIDPQKVERAIDLSKSKYCSVSAMLGKAAEIEYGFTIQPS